MIPHLRTANIHSFYKITINSVVIIDSFKFIDLNYIFIIKTYKHWFYLGLKIDTFTPLKRMILCLKI